MRFNVVIEGAKKKANIAIGPSKRNLFMILVIARVTDAGQFSRKVQNFASIIRSF
jgi:hypothetical protein